MRVLIVTNMYPTVESSYFGIFVKKQVESLQREGVATDVLFINGRKSVLNYITAIIKLNIMLKNSYDLIHAHYGLSGIVARMQWKVPVVVTFHGSDVNLPVQGFLSKILARHINKSIVVSSELRKKLKNKDAEVIPCGVDLNLMRPMPIEQAKKELGLDLNTSYLLFPANPDDKAKGYKLFNQVVKYLQSKGLKVQELILRNVPYEKVLFYYNASSVMVFTSEREGSPTVIKEALACNLPIVSVRVGDVEERIKGVVGCFLAERNLQDIANKVELALQSNKYKNGGEAVKNFSLEIIAKKIINIYADILG